MATALLPRRVRARFQSAARSRRRSRSRIRARDAVRTASSSTTIPILPRDTPPPPWSRARRPIATSLASIDGTLAQRQRLRGPHDLRAHLLFDGRAFGRDPRAFGGPPGAVAATRYRTAGCVRLRPSTPPVLGDRRRVHPLQPSTERRHRPPRSLGGIGFTTPIDRARIAAPEARLSRRVRAPSRARIQGDQRRRRDPVTRVTVTPGGSSAGPRRVCRRLDGRGDGGLLQLGHLLLGPQPVEARPFALALADPQAPRPAVRWLGCPRRWPPRGPATRATG